MRRDTIGSELEEYGKIVPRVGKTIQTHERCIVCTYMLGISGESPQYNAKRSGTVNRPKKEIIAFSSAW